MNYEQATRNCIFRFLSGSHAYGTNTPESDEDIRGVFMAPLSLAFDLFHTSFVGQGSLHDHLVGALEAVEAGLPDSARGHLDHALQVDQGDMNWSAGTVRRPGADEELQELRKFMKLAAQCNPNIIEFLYVDRNILHETEEWGRIRDAREMFLSQKARGTFAGYATAQLRRIQNHRRYLLSPPKEKPSRKAFGLPEETTVPQQYRGAILSVPDDYVQPEYRDSVRREKAYQEAAGDWKAYTRWSRERNPKRRELEAKAGYDSKHAMHLVRLLRMAVEILESGQVNVHRPDASELLHIRNGGWTYDDLMAHVDSLNERIDQVANVTVLRKKPDYNGIASLYRNLAEERYGISIGEE